MLNEPINSTDLFLTGKFHKVKEGSLLISYADISKR